MTVRAVSFALDPHQARELVDLDAGDNLKGLRAFFARAAKAKRAVVFSL
jgi:hypothetical protein